MKSEVRYFLGSLLVFRKFWAGRLAAVLA